MALNSAIDGRECPTTAIAQEHSTALFVPSELLLPLLSRHPDLNQKFLSCCSECMRDLIKQVEVLSLGSVRSRLCGHLLDLFAEAGVAPDERFRLPTTRAGLAQQIGTVREVATRRLRALHDAAVIHIDGRWLTVLDWDQLRAFAGRNRAGCQ